MQVTIYKNGMITTFENVKELKEINNNKIDIDYKPNKYIVRSERVDKTEIIQIIV